MITGFYTADPHEECKALLREFVLRNDFPFYIRTLRIQGYTWRAIAKTCRENWKELLFYPQYNWAPDCDCIVGPALCDIAASYYGESYLHDVWNN